jgi:hypothetical protein
MESEGSLWCSQKPTTSPYPEPAASSTQLPILFPKIHSNIILPLTPSLSIGPFPSGYPTKILYVFLISLMHTTCPAISLSLISSS